MSRLGESDECERCGDRTSGLRRLCSDCTRDDLTLEQRREIAEALSTRVTSFEVEQSVDQDQNSLQEYPFSEAVLGETGWI